MISPLIKFVMSSKLLSPKEMELTNNKLMIKKNNFEIQKMQEVSNECVMYKCIWELRFLS